MSLELANKCADSDLVEKVIKTVPVPKWRNRVDIYLNRNDSETERLAARLSLDTLGFATNVKRAFGKFTNVCVMELPEKGPEAVVGTT